MQKHHDLDPRHAAPMKAALMKHRSVVDEPLMNRMYRLAQNSFGDERIQGEGGITLVRVVTRNSEGVNCIVTVTCTDDQTGLFIQLSGDSARGFSGAMLSFGQRYCQEHWDNMRRHIVTKIW
jgi:hypothetical protein